MLARDATHGPVIHDLNRTAAHLGLKRGARITDMRALVPDLRVDDAMPDADKADLITLARWAQRWCPWSQTDGDDALLLDTAGSEHLHGGEAAMLVDMRRAFARVGLTVKTACAPTPGAAWALARYGTSETRSTPATLADDLASLPVAALRLHPDTVSLLNRLGLKTVAAVAALPREALIRRFRRADALAANPVRRLDQAMGRLAEPLTPVSEHRPLRSHRKVLEPVTTTAALTHILEALTSDLSTLMRAQCVGARCLRFTGYRVDGLPVSVDATTSLASHDAAHLSTLFAGRLDGLDVGFGIEATTLEALIVDPMNGTQGQLARDAQDDIVIQHLIDRLMMRLGTMAVTVPTTQGSHLPERCSIFISAAQEAAHPRHPVEPGAPRPLRMLDTPEPARVTHAVPEGPPAQMVWRRIIHRIVKVEGPERIAPEWWRQKSSTRLRDYYRVEDSEGHRYWIYREGLPDDGRGGHPNWFVHGIDA